MGRATRRKKTRAEAAEKDVLDVLYNRRGPLLYGAIRLYKHSTGTGPITQYKHSAPFVVSETIAPGEVVVHGSVGYLIQDIQRVIKKIHSATNELADALSHVTPRSFVQGERARLEILPESDQARRLYFESRRNLAGMLILLSAQARNLFDLFPRLDRPIPLSEADGKRTSDIKLSNLFAHFVHNQYVFLNGEHVSDLFPAKPRGTSPIARTFMGYRFNWIEYVEAIDAAIRDVRLKDLTGLLRGRLKRLSLNSPFSDIVFLLQNLVSFSKLLGVKVADRRYQGILSLLFDDEINARYRAFMLEMKVEVGEAVQVNFDFHTPRLSIHERLIERKFKIYANCKWTFFASNGRLLHEDQDFHVLTKEVGYELLLDHVARAFGDDSLLTFHVK